MKVRRLVWLVVIIVLVVAALALVSDLFGTTIPALQLIHFRHVTQFSTSSITLESVRDLYAFNTVRYVRRVVFPYDYLPQGVSINAILRKLRATNTTAHDALTDDEYRYYQTYILANDVDLSTTGGTFDFVVVSLVVTAGFDLSAGTDAVDVQEFQTDAGMGAKRAIVTLAPVVITDISVEDIDRDDYPYPDASLSADGWRRVTDYIRRVSVAPDVQREILDTARSNGEAFLRGVLDRVGFAEVQFRTGS